MLAQERTTSLSVSETYVANCFPAGNRDYANCLIMKVCEFVKKWDGISNHHKLQADDLLGIHSTWINDIVNVWPHLTLRNKSTANRLGPLYRKFYQQFPINLEVCLKTIKLIKDCGCFLVVNDKLCVDPDGHPIQARIIGRTVKDEKLAALFNESSLILGHQIETEELYICCLSESLMKKFLNYTEQLRTVARVTAPVPRAVHWTPSTERNYLLNRPKERSCTGCAIV